MTSENGLECVSCVSAVNPDAGACEGPGQRAAMDLAVLPYTPDGYCYLLVYQDYYSKFIELFPLKEKTAKAIAEKLVCEVFTRYGVVRDLHADQGKEFKAALMYELCSIWSITRTRTNPFTPWSNGMLE